VALACGGEEGHSRTGVSVKLWHFDGCHLESQSAGALTATEVGAVALPGQRRAVARSGQPGRKVRTQPTDAVGDRHGVQLGAVGCAERRRPTGSATLDS